MLSPAAVLADDCGGTADAGSALCCVEPTAPAAPAPATEPDRSGPLSPTLPPGIAAQRIVVDPETGLIVAEPPAVETRPQWMGRALSHRVSTSHAGLVEEPGPAGSVKVDLRGRFTTMLEGRVGPEGEVSVGHAVPVVEPLPPAAEAGEEQP